MAEPSNRPHLPPLVESDGGIVPAAPEEARSTGIDPAVLADLALRAAQSVPQFNTEWMARRLHLPQAIVGDLLEELRTNLLLETLGQAGPFGYRFAISGRGRERAARLFEISGYVGPAPVPLEAYTAMIEWQLKNTPEITEQDVSKVLGDLVLDESAARSAGLAASSGRSLLVFGPPGNGKTSLGHALHRALRGDLWIPYCIEVDGNIIRLFDSHVHHVIEADEPPWLIDRRWVRIQRPLIVGGGEMTLDSFDLAYSPNLRYYEAPPHLKANGGMFLIDDFGRQRVDPHELLNRWIIPLEHRIDYLTLHTGQKIQVPFLLRLIIATNLGLDDVTDPAFLRRMGYRLFLDRPTPERYAEIFGRYAERRGLAVPTDLLPWLFARYQAEGRELRGCEPRDLIERVCDLCRYQGYANELSPKTLELAWMGYFGSQ